MRVEINTETIAKMIFDLAEEVKNLSLEEMTELVEDTINYDEWDEGEQPEIVSFH